ncbi:hypothetical protein HanPI659440_Chr12g0457951 [Helianthus annuus]|nr:hypothetical protein HanPI659440_Chr12g0457951 [Helianthus annuus]
MDTSRPNLSPFFPNTPATPSTQSPFVYPTTSIDQYSFGSFSQPQNAWQMQYQQSHHAMQMQSQALQMPLSQLLTQIAPEHDLLSLAVDDDVITKTQLHTMKAKKGKKTSTRRKPSTSSRRGKRKGAKHSWDSGRVESLHER